jgi:hypothetical protein
VVWNEGENVAAKWVSKEDAEKQLGSVLLSVPRILPCGVTSISCYAANVEDISTGPFGGIVH